MASTSIPRTIEKSTDGRRGEEAYALQVIIRGKTYAVHAAVCEDGFLAWQVFECNVASAEVCKFIRDKLAPVFPSDAFLILDNASNQKHASVQIAMEGYLQGRYFYCSPYSPKLKPIERAFSMVRSWIRNHENDPAESKDLINCIRKKGREGIIATIFSDCTMRIINFF